MKKTKKLLSLILTMAILISTFFMPVFITKVNAATSTTNQTGGTPGTWNYTLVDGKATDVYCSSTLSGEVVIPSLLNGYPVVSIKGAGSYKNMFNVSSNTTITSVMIPNSVTSIGDYAFYQCKGLTSITIPDSVTSIGNQAFYECTSLVSVIIPDSVTHLGAGAFQYCTKLSSVTISNSITAISNNAFDCTSLVSVIIPNSVTTIGEYAFMSCTSLTSVTIPDSVHSINRLAFYNCTSLPSVIIPDSVTFLGYWAFARCLNLTSVTISSHLVSSECKFSLVPSFVISNDNTVLYNVPNTTCGSYVIPSSITTIDSDAFQNCTQISSLTIPNLVTSINGNAFFGIDKSTIIVHVEEGSYAATWVRNNGFANINYYVKINEQVEQATEAVTKAERTKDQADVDTARYLVDEISNNETKLNLTNRLDVVQQYIDTEIAYIAQVDEAETAVSIAETTKLQSDVDYATLLVNTLREDDKLLLFTRVEAVQSYIDDVSVFEQAEEILVIAEATRTTDNVNTAWEKISALPNGDIKDDYVMLLANIDSNYQNAVVKVEKAENYATNRDYIISADESTKALTDYNVLKANLTQRVQKLKDDYNRAIAEKAYYYNTDKATHYVVQSERNPANYNLNKAQEYINLLREDDPVRIELQARLDAIKDRIALAELTKAIQDAAKAVANAEKYRKASYVDKAQPLIDALPDIAEKQALQDRLDVIVLK